MALSLQTTGQRKPYQRGLGTPQQQPSVFGQAKPLQAPQPLTQAGGLAQQKNLQGLQTGQFGDVQSAQNATNRAGALRQYQAIQSSRANAMRGNLSTEQAQRMQDQSLASANSQNLTAQNSVNAMQRQYGQDAINQANAYEKDAYGMATNERGYQDSRSDLGYSRATDEKRYGDSRGDVAFGQNLQTQQFQAGRSDTAFNQGMAKDQFGANRQDAAFSQGLARDQFGANRDDAMYSRGYQQNRDAIGDQRYDQSYSDSRADLGYNRATDEARYGDTRADVADSQQFRNLQYGDQRADVKYGQQYQAGRDAVGDQRYGQEYADSRGDINYSRGIDESRYADTRGDVQYQRGYQETRDAVGDTRYDQSYADQRSDVKYGQDYQASRDQVGDTRYDAATAYSQNRDAIGDQRYDQTYQDQRGDVQYQRGYQETRDAVGDTRYDSETAYNQSRDAVGDQRYDATTAYNQSRDAVGDQRYDATTQYQQSRDALADTRYDDATAYNRTEAQRLEGKGDVNTLISSVQDPRAQNLLRNVQAQGGDVQSMYNTMLDNGTIKEEYRSATPGQTAAAATIDELKALYPKLISESGLDNESDADYEKRITEMAQQEREMARAPINQASTDQQIAAIQEKLRLGQPLTQAEKDLSAGKGNTPSMTLQTIPRGTNQVNEFLKTNPSGVVRVGDQDYTVKSGGRTRTGSGTFSNQERHTDYVVVQDSSGATKYIYDGKVQASPPRQVSNDISPFGF